ncbi:hypothetical protein EsDP_00004381 [Epichloe bromicola]|uniref:Uncharacterized protein n=1 Tax=Epichloe bromicola TaxID=79588 RepID=A0ABQ0CRJ1_9HYPO
MRGPVYIIAVLSTLITAGGALPQPEVLPRAADTTSKPKYSVVPLEPGDDDPSQGGGNGGNGGKGGNSGKEEHASSAHTVVKTVLKTEQPITQTVIRTEAPVIVTKPVPTTVFIIPIGGNKNATMTVAAEATSTAVSKPCSVSVETSSKTSGSTTSILTTLTASTSMQVISSATTSSAASTTFTHVSSLETTQSTPSVKLRPPFSSKIWSIPTSNSIIRPSTNCTRPTSTISHTTTASGANRASPTSTLVTTTALTVVPTTFSTIFSPPESSTSTKTYDDGQWHTTYPSWNGTTTPQGLRKSLN